VSKNKTVKEKSGVEREKVEPSLRRSLASAYTASIVAVNKNTYTLVQVNGVFTSNNVGNSTSLFLGSSHCYNVMLDGRFTHAGKREKKREGGRKKDFENFFTKLENERKWMSVAPY